MNLQKLAGGIIFSFLISGCEGFLDPKPSNSLIVPTSLEDVRNLLDNNVVFNRQPVLVIPAGDEFYPNESAISQISEVEQGTYFWEEDPYRGTLSVADWELPYQQVFYANVALDALDNFKREKNQAFFTLRGEALFHRAYAYFNLLQQFAPPYQQAGGNDRLLGIVIKEKSDVNESVSRSDLETSYQQVLTDLTEAIGLLPEFQSPKTRPSKAAAYGFLARVKLVMFKYEDAAEAAKNSLEIYRNRFDFNTLDLRQLRPFPADNNEVIFFSGMISIAFNSSGGVFTDSTLVKLYEIYDLRKEAYLDLAPGGRFLYRGRLTGTNLVFGGVSVGEVQLIAAEGLVRSGNDTEALKFLNELLELRFLKGRYTPLNLKGRQLLTRILDERKKELLGRGVRWSDLRRLNQDSDFAVSIRKMKGNEVLELEPGSPRYTFSIPLNEIFLSGIEQNRR